MQYQSSTKGSTVEKPAETQTSILLASHLVAAPNSRSGGHEYESLLWREMGALTNSRKILGSGLSTTFAIFYYFFEGETRFYTCDPLLRRRGN